MQKKSRNLDRKIVNDNQNSDSKKKGISNLWSCGYFHFYFLTDRLVGRGSYLLFLDDEFLASNTRV